MTAAVVFHHVSKRFRLERERDRSFQELAVNIMRRLRQLRSKEDFWALRDVHFAVHPGETLGIIGENGSGKSTTLKLISRILEPTEGWIEVNGRVSALLELGAGFHPDLTGRENIYLNASLLGFSRREIRRRIEEIITFSELGRFIGIPVKFYSSGMYMRLGFAIAINVDPDILLTDEVLAVGDEGFQRKCLSKITELQERGKTILFVSHSMDAIRNLCTRALWLNEGRIQEIGDVERVVDAYMLFVQEKEAKALEQRSRQLVEMALPASEEPSLQEEPSLWEEPSLQGEPFLQEEPLLQEELPLQEESFLQEEPSLQEDTADIVEPEQLPPQVEPDRWGSREIHFLEVRFLDENGQACFLHRSGAPATIEMTYEADCPVDDPVFGIAIYRQDGVWVYGTNTAIDDIPIGRALAQGVVRFLMPALHLIEGQYWLAAAVHARDGTPYDYWQHCWEFTVSSRVNDSGIYRPEHHWEMEVPRE